jgi:hypothetical protein
VGAIMGVCKDCARDRNGSDDNLFTFLPRTAVEDVKEIASSRSYVNSPREDSTFSNNFT